MCEMDSSIPTPTTWTSPRWHELAVHHTSSVQITSTEHIIKGRQSVRPRSSLDRNPLQNRMTGQMNLESSHEMAVSVVCDAKIQISNSADGTNQQTCWFCAWLLNIVQFELWRIASETRQQTGPLQSKPARSTLSHITAFFSTNYPCLS